LRLPGWSPAADQLPLRARPWPGATPAGPLSLFDGREDRSRVLIALGTTLFDREAFDTLVDVVSLLDGVDVLAAVAPGVDHPMTDRRENVRVVGFVPMASLLTVGFSVVVAAGGAGTVLAALGQGIPMVIWPEGARRSPERGAGRHRRSRRAGEVEPARGAQQRPPRRAHRAGGAAW
jgi:UDP:flavonoid glycosyltransferase YjiC (YdhE family)